MTVLLRAQKLAGAPYLKVAHGNTEARTELRELLYCRKTFGCRFCQYLVGFECEVSVAKP